MRLLYSNRTHNISIFIDLTMTFLKILFPLTSLHLLVKNVTVLLPITLSYKNCLLLILLESFSEKNIYINIPFYRQSLLPWASNSFLSLDKFLSSCRINSPAISNSILVSRRFLKIIKSNAQWHLLRGWFLFVGPSPTMMTSIAASSTLSNMSSIHQGPFHLHSFALGTRSQQLWLYAEILTNNDDGTWK